ncbi:MAG: imidazole glycerol phosphate synthase subunit HisH [Anaerolineae bacterium]|nr:imidazole glycerol phosphate synthase subunit HisH [Anaerolineae bacterium]
MITIVDYKAGNLTSVKRALDHLGIANQISADPDLVRKADRIIFPGVGAAGAAMDVLKERNLDSALKESFRRGAPILGICIGCQIILSRSEEGDTPGLDLIEGVCSKFEPEDEALKVPHMGWNAVDVHRPHPILQHLKPGDEFYFVHSYYPQPVNPETIYATSNYGLTFPAAIGVDNLFAVQFHAEKSGPIGLHLLKNFSSWRP